MPRRSSTSMKDVATLAGVSLGTVSNVVNSPDLVSPATRERVETAIKKLGWVPNESARQLRAGRSRVVSVVVMDIGNPFFTDVLRGAEDWVLGHGYHVQASNSASLPERESEQLRVLEQQRVGGVLWAPVSGPSERADALRRRGIPVVIVDRAGDGTGYCSVSVDDVEGGRLATAHLLASGHTSIAVVGGPGTLHQVRDRRLGAEIARGQHGASATLLFLSTASTGSASGVAAADQLVALPDAERPTAVFAMNDLLAIGLLQGFVTHGLRVPEDVALVGYDDISYAASAAVPLSSVRQPRQALGERAAELLFAEIEATDHDTPHEHQSVRFTPELVVRRSSALTRG
ncbi:LacI family DNA-binding transcriptional regulator [Microlunatus flavus]|uniref:LacI family transcriptional regulator n=1 Tax=Microlunatus flavus TaxID=1036181 RepID=A0A1H9DB92_9ACTN|nr:LacI family DNA-binding transcriptional regulator [Microlunatus flavus]SEQ10103.1 LacI family transcriptional regulator [Microlunatus flavus]